MTSPYAIAAGRVRDQGYPCLPVAPGTKFPGVFSNGIWAPMPGWQKYCGATAGLPPEFVHLRWDDWPEAGICIPHGRIIGLDIDTDRADVQAAVHKAILPPQVRRRGAKGWMGYFRPGGGLDDLTARVRWYDRDGNICVELLMDGTQSVIPPTVHPKTGQPYAWLTQDTLESTPIEDLPEFTGADLSALDREFTRIGLTRKAPRKVDAKEYDRPAPGAHDLEKPFGRSMNDRAMAAMDLWWPALEMPKSRQRGAGAWEAVPFWRASGSGRALHDRNPNLRAVSSGIVDFGDDRRYTPIDLVMAARDCSFQSAIEWLGQFVTPEEQADFSAMTAPEAVADPGDIQPAAVWSPTPAFMGGGRRITPSSTPIPSDKEWKMFMPDVPPPFPIQDFGVLDGLLGEVVTHLDNASVVATEAGALAAALPLLGAAMGQAFATPTGLRTNVYSVALGESGGGKTVLMNPGKELMAMAKLADLIGADRFVSGAGILTMLSAKPRCICFLDEFGHTLQQLGAPGAGSHAHDAIRELTALYSAAGSIVTGSARASATSSQIVNPNLCIFGMATPEQFWSAFGSSSLADGSVARYMIFPIGETADKMPDTSAAESVAQRLDELQAAISARITGNMGRVDALVVPLDDYAEKARADLKIKERAFAVYAKKNGIRGGPAIIKRVTENALKIALISAVGRNFSAPEIDGRDMDIGHALAWWSANVMITNIASHIADNQTEANINLVERKIRESGEDGILASVLSNRIRSIPKREVSEIVERLVDADVVTRVMTEGKTKRGWKLVHSSLLARVNHQ